MLTKYFFIIFSVATPGPCPFFGAPVDRSEVMSCPAALAMAKLSYPETEISRRPEVFRGRKMFFCLVFERGKKTEICMIVFFCGFWEVLGVLMVVLRRIYASNASLFTFKPPPQKNNIGQKKRFWRSTPEVRRTPPGPTIWKRSPPTTLGTCWTPWPRASSREWAWPLGFLKHARSGWGFWGAGCWFLGWG